MFTGLITDCGCVRSIERREDWRFAIDTGYDTATIALGASIAVSGVCLSAVAKGEGWFAVDVSAETLSRTTLGTWEEGTLVNLERSLRLGDELGGHLVSGHVDGAGTVVTREAVGGSIRFSIAAPGALMGLIAPKGSIAVDGVSLTVNHVEDEGEGGTFEVNIIPHTAAVTTLGEWQEGRRVNLEIDMLARYVQRLLGRKIGAHA